MRRNIVRAAYYAKRYRLWDPHNRILGQEPDLWKRMVRVRSLSNRNASALLSINTCVPFSRKMKSAKGVKCRECGC